VSEPEFVSGRSSISVHRDRPLPHAAQEFLKVLTAELRGLSAAPRANPAGASGSSD
jgi:hypothetical protein